MAKTRHIKPVQLKEGLFAVLSPGTEYIGPIRELSTEGLTFRYIANNLERPAALSVDIFSEGASFDLRGVPCRVIADSHLHTADDLTMNQCGIQFVSPTTAQRRLLDELIQQFAE